MAWCLTCKDLVADHAPVIAVGPAEGLAPTQLHHVLHSLRGQQSSGSSAAALYCRLLSGTEPLRVSKAAEQVSRSA